MTEKKKISEKLLNIVDEIEILQNDETTRGILLQAIRHLKITIGSMKQYEELQTLTSKKVYFIGENGIPKLMSENEILRLIANRERNRYNEETKNVDRNSREHSIISEVDAARRSAREIQQYGIFRKAFPDSVPRDADEHTVY